MIGARIRLVRQYLGISQQDLARAAEINQSVISRVEQGGAAGADLLACVSRVTGYAVSYFDRGPLPDLPETSLRFRKRSSSRRSDEKRLRAYCVQLVELLSEIEKRVSLPPVMIQSVERAIDGEDIETLAVFVRHQLGAKHNEPLKGIATAIERKGGVVVGALVESAKIDGACLWAPGPGGRPLICFNRDAPGDRQRLSIAHELGHLILHRRIDPQWSYGIASQQLEKQAFQFGSALLMPRSAAKGEINSNATLRDLAIVKAKWGVSIAALIRRAYELGIIPNRRYRSLNKQLAMRGWRKSEPVSVPTQKPRLLTEAIRAAFGSLAEAGEETGISAMAIRDLAA